MIKYIWLSTEPCKSAPTEIAFVVDRSGSMYKAWPKVKEWLQKAVNAYKIDGKTRKGGFVLWDDYVHEDKTIRFTDNKTEAELTSIFDSIGLPEGGTDGGAALEYTYENLFKTGSDPSVDRQIIYLSDGENGLGNTPMEEPAKKVWKTGYLKIAKKIDFLRSS